jgi:SAM-dependent methyltransferase
MSHLSVVEQDPEKLLSDARAAGGPVTLDVGCGPHKRGTIGVDIHPFEGVDLVLDITQGLPFPEDSFDGATMFHVLEHLPRTAYEPLLTEVWRCLRPGAVFRIKVPHFSCGREFWQDPTHVRPFAINAFTEYFRGSRESGQNFGHTFRFACTRAELHYNTFPEAARPRLRPVVRLLEWLANGTTKQGIVPGHGNTQQRLCERRWCYLVGGFGEIDAELTALKPLDVPA